MVKFEFETDYVQLLFRDLVEERIFRGNDGIIQETQLKGCNKIVDFLVKLGDKAIGIEVKVWPKPVHFNDCLKYDQELDAVFLAVPQEYVGLAKKYRTDERKYKTVGIIGVSLNSRSSFFAKASPLNPRKDLRDNALQKFYYAFYRKGQDEIQEWIEVSKRYLKKIRQAHAAILEEFFRKDAFKYTFPLIALYITARVHSPFKYLSWGNMVNKDYAKQKLYWENKIPVWPELYSLEVLGFVDRYSYGTEIPHMYYKLSYASYMQVHFLEKKVDEYARKMGLTGSDALFAKIQNRILHEQHRCESEALQS